MNISIAEFQDLLSILKLQYAAYQSEAILYNNFNIPPLTQTLTDLQAEAGKSIILKATDNDSIFGSVRGFKTGNICQIGRLIVHPDRQRQGIGSSLLHAIENYFPETENFELFTGSKSVGNLQLYNKYGYQEFKKEQLTEKIEIIYMRKLNAGFAPHN